MTQQFPIGEQVKLSVMDTNPYPTFKQMLTDEPVSWIREIDMWYVTRRDDVLRILADTDTFTVVSDESLMRQAVGYNMLTTDGLRSKHGCVVHLLENLHHEDCGRLRYPSLRNYRIS